MTEKDNNKTSVPPIYPLPAYRYSTIQDFIDAWQKIIPTGKKKYTPSDLLKVKNEKGVSNLDIIWGTYDKEEQAKYKSDYDSGTIGGTSDDGYLFMESRLYQYAKNNVVSRISRLSVM